MDIQQLRKPRCFLLYALAPEHVSPSGANQVINQICADATLPLTLFHDHFIGQAGGIVLFYAESADERQALQDGLASHLHGWEYVVHPLIYSRNPAGFDEQIAYTLRAYRDTDWESLQKIKRPSYGDPRLEAETARESD